MAQTAFSIHKQGTPFLDGTVIWDVSGEFGDAIIQKQGGKFYVAFNGGAFEPAMTYATAISRCYARHCTGGPA